MKHSLLKGFSAIVRFPGQVFVWWKNEFPFLALLIPIVIGLVILAVSSFNLFGWHDEGLAKDQLEIAHPSLLAIAVILSILGRILYKDLSLSFMILLSGALLSREILGQGNSWIVYLAIIILIVWAEFSQKGGPTSLKNHKPATIALFLAFFSYLISQILDRGLIKTLMRFVSGDPELKIPYSSNIEESLETLGGFFVVLTIIHIMRYERQQTKSN